MHVCDIAMFQVRDLEVDKTDLERTINDMKLKADLAEKQAEEQKEAEEKKHGEEIQFLKRTNQQLKVNHFASCYSIICVYSLYTYDEQL